MDVAIVGAGPAGSAAGWRLARSGHRVTLYDPSHPREKPCGGGLPAGAFDRYPELRELLPIGRSHTHVELRSPRGRSLRIDLPEPIRVCSRRAFDERLLERALAAGAQLRPQRVRDVRVEARSVRLLAARGEFHHDFVVGADGAASVVRRALLGRRPGGAATCATAGFHVFGLPESELVVEFLPELPGYLWVFPREEHASVGVVCPARRLGGRALRARVFAFLARRYPDSERLPRIPYGASIPCPTESDATRACLGGERFALVGDAAGQVDAITGEGIEHAIGSAATLAAALDEAGARRASSLYALRWRRSGGRELAVAARWAARWYRPWLVEAALWVASRDPDARRLMAELMMVRQPYSGLRNRVLRGIWRRLVGASSPARAA